MEDVLNLDFIQHAILEFLKELIDNKDIFRGFNILDAIQGSQDFTRKNKIEDYKK